MVGEEKRHQMMQNLFGDQSEEEEEEEEVESEHESNRQPDSASDDADGGPEPEGEDEGEVEGQGRADLESEGEPMDLHPVHGESGDERDQSSQEVDIGDQREESEVRFSESDEKEDYDQNNVTSRRHNVVDSGSERSGDNHYAANVEEKVNQTRSPRSSGDEKDEEQFLQSAPEIRDVFGDSDEEEAEYEVQNQMDDGNRSPMGEDEEQPMGYDEEQNEKELRPEDMIPDDDAPYYSEEEHIEAKSKEKPTGPPLELDIPLCHPPTVSKKMHMIKVSNIMGIDPKPFNPRTYVEEDFYETDESGSKKRIRLENNVVRWRQIKNRDGSTSVESNARFVEWSDGSLQLHIGNEVLNISKQGAQHEQAHLFMRHGKGLLQSQGRILTKMRFMPSSLSSNSHRLLTALVDSRHKKVFRIKNCVTNIDPEREKEQKEKAENQSIRASEHLSRKKEKVNRKYAQPRRKERQLSPGFLEDDPEEEDDYQPRRSAVHRRASMDLDQEARAEKRIINAKKGSNKSAFSAAKPSRRPIDFSDSEKEESEYETDGDEDADQYGKEEEDHYAEEDEEREQEEEEAYDESEEEVQEKQKVRNSGGSKRKDIDSDDDSPPRKTTAHRRMTMIYDSDEE